MQKMRSPSYSSRTPVNIQPSLHLVDLFEESVSYDRFWRLPFNALSLCVKEDPEDPSFVEVARTGERFFYKEGIISFTACDTPMRIRYTTGNLHYCIHFRYELFPGMDLFSGLCKRYMLEDPLLEEKIRHIFTEKDPVKKIATAEAVLMESILRFWPGSLPLDLSMMEKFSPLLRYVDDHLDSQLGIPEMAELMGWSQGHFSRVFHKVFHITPKQYLLRELFARALNLLKDPEKSIKEVAEELKFSSEFNFSRFIRQHSSYTPSQLRRKNPGPLYIRK